MRGVQNIVHHFYTSSIFFIFILFRPTLSTHANTLSSKDFLTVSSNRTIVSPGDVFELGFFSRRTPNNSRWYLGIWYKNIPERTYVWVANRDKPLSNSIGTLKMSYNNLVLLDQSKNIVWSTNLTTRYVKSQAVAELLGNGNFVMRYSNDKNNDPSGYLWQSFDFPTDTLLPEMKLGFDLKTGSNKFLTSWRSPYDPSSGDYSYKLETRGVPEFFLRIKDYLMYRTGPWNGIRFSDIPDMPQLSYMVTNSTFTFLMTNHSTYSRLTINPLGYIEQSMWIPEVQGWSLLWLLPKDQCDFYNQCGPYAYCDAKTSMCNCIKGFKPKNELKDRFHGCARESSLSCKGDRFLRMMKMKLPDTTTAIVDQRIGIKECYKRCASDCSCIAFANIRKSGSGCVIWTQELVDMRNYVNGGGQDLYVRLAAADLG